MSERSRSDSNAGEYTTAERLVYLLKKSMSKAKPLNEAELAELRRVYGQLTEEQRLGFEARAVEERRLAKSQPKAVRQQMRAAEEELIQQQMEAMHLARQPQSQSQPQAQPQPQLPQQPPGTVTSSSTPSYRVQLQPTASSAGPASDNALSAATVVAFQAEREQWSRTLHDQQMRIVELEAARQADAARIADLTATVSRLREQQQQADAVTAAALQQRAEIQRLTAELASTQAQLRQSESTRQLLEARVAHTAGSALPPDVPERVLSLVQEQRMALARAMQAQRSLEQQAARVHELEVELAAARAQLSESRGAVGVLQQQMHSQSQQLSMMSASDRTADRQLAELSARLMSTQTQLHETKQRVQQWREGLAAGGRAVRHAAASLKESFVALREGSRAALEMANDLIEDFTGDIARAWAAQLAKSAGTRVRVPIRPGPASSGSGASTPTAAQPAARAWERSTVAGSSSSSSGGGGGAGATGVDGSPGGAAESRRGSVSVFCRVRAPEASETASVLIVDGHTVTAMRGHDQRTFVFDGVFGPQADSDRVAMTLLPLLTAVVEGRPACVLAYGPSGSGKTHTLNEITPRLTAELFVRIMQRRGAHSTVNVSAVELAGETARDLLAPPQQATLRALKQDAAGHSFIPGLTAVAVSSGPEADRVLLLARSRRSNDPYSHAVVSLVYATPDGRCGRLVLVDLAPSDRVPDTELVSETARLGQRAMKDLSALGGVLAALSAGQTYVPYRNSRLTHMLSEALSPEASVALLLHVRAGAGHQGSSLATLSFGAIAQSGDVTHRHRAEHLSDIRAYRRTIDRLKAELARTDGVAGAVGGSDV